MKIGFIADAALVAGALDPEEVELGVDSAELALLALRIELRPPVLEALRLPTSTAELLDPDPEALRLPVVDPE